MSKYVVNVEKFTDYKGKDITIGEEVEVDGAIKVEKTVPSLAGWLIILLDAIPRVKLTYGNAAKAFSIKSTCAHTPPGQAIAMNDDHYEWLLLALFNDAEGARLVPADPQRSVSGFEGAFAFCAFGDVAFAIEEALKKTITEDEAKRLSKAHSNGKITDIDELRAEKVKA